MAPKRVAFVVFPGIQSLDLAGPFEVFSGANEVRAHAGQAPAYELRIVARTSEPVASESGLRVVPDLSITRLRGSVDTLIVAGGSGIKEAVKDRVLLRGVERLAKDARRVVS